MSRALHACALFMNAIALSRVAKRAHAHRTRSNKGQLPERPLCCQPASAEFDTAQSIAEARLFLNSHSPPQTKIRPDVVWPDSKQRWAYQRYATCGSCMRFHTNKPITIATRIGIPTGAINVMKANNHEDACSTPDTSGSSQAVGSAGCVKNGIRPQSWMQNGCACTIATGSRERNGPCSCSGACPARAHYTAIDPRRF
jgi:hypothetical protein